MKGPEAGQDVYLTLGERGSTNARVASVNDGVYLFTLPAELRDSAPSFTGQDASVQFTSRRGVCRLDGKIPVKGFIGDRLRFEGAGKIKLIQRRDFVRLDAVVPVKYQASGIVSLVREGYTLNVSGGGFMLAPPHEVRLGAKLRFWLELDEDAPPVGVVGLAVRQVESGAVGIKFDDISDEDRERVVHWVFARERLSRQVTRDGK